MLEVDYVVISALGYRLSTGVSKLNGNILNAVVTVLFACKTDRQIVADEAMRIFMYHVVAV